jgi:hypothetical protein
VQKLPQLIHPKSTDSLILFSNFTDKKLGRYDMSSKINATGFAAIVFLLTGCFTNQTVTSNTAITVNTVALPSSPRAVRVVFQTGSSGSFNSVGTQGTTPGYGNGLQAVTVYDPTNNNTMIATGGPSGTNWPAWLSNFEIGISGSSNPKATNSNCARFANPGEQASQCAFNGSGAACVGAGTCQPCGATGGQFRVSEVDCGSSGTTAPGNGTASDGVYFRATFNRDPSVLGPTENIMVVVEYAASSYNPAPQNPANCFVNAQTGFAPEQCADFSWKAFLRSDPTSATQPFLMMIPPTPFYVNGSTSGTSSANLVTKQFILPIASNPALNEVQFSRITSNLNSAFMGATPYNNFLGACSPSGLPANSPLCAGLIISSVTFYRI